MFTASQAASHIQDLQGCNKIT